MKYRYTEIREDTGEVIHAVGMTEAEARAYFGDDLFQHHYGTGQPTESHGMQVNGSDYLMSQLYEVRN